MTLRARIKTAVDTAFTKLGDIPETGTLTRETAGAYDAGTGQVAVTAATYTFAFVQADQTISQAMGSAMRGLDNRNVAPNDLRVIIQASSLVASGGTAGSGPAIAPQEGDEVTARSVGWVVRTCAPLYGAAFDVLLSRQGSAQA